MQKKFFIYLPLVPGSVEQEWEQCLEQIVKTTSAGFRPLKLNIYTDLHDYQTYIVFRQKIAESVKRAFGDESPAFNVTVHPPEEPWKIVVEALFVLSVRTVIKTKYLNSVPYVVLETESVKEVWGAGLGSDLYQYDTRKAAEKAFDQMVGILENEKMSLNHLVRQWNYIGNILKVKEEFQNYQIFNEVRSEYYQKYRTVKGFPAATGVGMRLGGVILDFCAVAARESVRIVPIDNPNQVNAYDYGQQVLKGMAGKGQSVKHPPQFERALLLVNNQFATLYISGTASIIGQETIGRGDVEEQTIVTIENIKKMADTEGINQLLGGLILYSSRFSLVRVYIKNRNDFGIVKAVCEEHFPDVPAVYILADVCRDDLLTEIEAELLLKF
ncbi:MAG TPA: hypothetical protein VMW32_10410 [Bacteroidales bacterium]|nr:hypothetical protein [Bacteroidales bacterium]